MIEFISRSVHADKKFFIQRLWFVLVNAQTHTQAVILLAQLASSADNDNIPFLYCHKFVTSAKFGSGNTGQVISLLSVMQYNTLLWARWNRSVLCGDWKTELEPGDVFVILQNQSSRALQVLAGSLYCCVLLHSFCYFYSSSALSGATVVVNMPVSSSVILSVDSTCTNGTWWFRLLWLLVYLVIYSYLLPYFVVTVTVHCVSENQTLITFLNNSSKCG